MCVCVCVHVGFQRQFPPLMLIHKDEWMNGRMDDVFDFIIITAAVPFVMFDANVLMLHSTLEQFAHHCNYQLRNLLYGLV